MKLTPKEKIQFLTTKTQLPESRSRKRRRRSEELFKKE